MPLPLVQQIPNFNLKVVFLVHFIFISLSTMGFWASNAYLFYNSILIVLLVWSIYHGQSTEPVQLAIVVSGASIILDVLLLVMCYPDSNRARERFSAAMAILNLFVRPGTTYVLIRNLDERNGAPGNMSEFLVGRRQESYEDIDRNATPAGPGGYDYSTAQQI